jgi:DNA modification methylase
MGILVYWYVLDGSATHRRAIKYKVALFNWHWTTSIVLSNMHKVGSTTLLTWLLGRKIVKSYDKEINKRFKKQISEFLLSFVLSF